MLASLEENDALANRSLMPSGNLMSAWFGVVFTLDAWSTARNRVYIYPPQWTLTNMAIKKNQIPIDDLDSEILMVVLIADAT